MQIYTPFQSFVEDFIRTAEANGHKGSALLSTTHPAIRAQGWSQIRKLMQGTLAFYRDELGNVVELRLCGKTPTVIQTDPRRKFFCRLRGASTGYTIQAEDTRAARQAFASREVSQDTTYLIVTTHPATGIIYETISK